jgi:hypothetical protein
VSERQRANQAGAARAQARQELAGGDVRLEELLLVGEEPRRLRRRDTQWWWLAKIAIIAAVASAAIVICARVLAIGLPYALVFSGMLALLLLRRVLAGVTPVPLPGPRMDTFQAAPPPPDGMAAAAARWNTRLNWTESDPAAFSRSVLPALADIADERLRQRHGLTRASDPERARALLGDPLWTLLADPITRSLTPRQFAAVIAQLEAL